MYHIKLNLSMHKMILSLAFAFSLTAIPVTANDENLEAELFAYLDSIRTLSGRYEQFSLNRPSVTGNFHLQRPGKIHFAEDAENGIILIADGSWIGIINRESGEAPQYPLESTPFASLLSDLPSQDPTIELIQISQENQILQAVFVRKDETALGEMTLVFQKEPIRMLGWQIKDAQGQITVVRLDIEETNQPVAQRLFRIHLFQ